MTAQFYPVWPICIARAWRDRYRHRCAPTSIGQGGVAVGVLGPGDTLMVARYVDATRSRPRRGRAIAYWWNGDRVPSLPEFGWQLSHRVKS